MEQANQVSFIHGLLRAMNGHDPEHVASFYAPDHEGLDVSRASLRLGRAGVREDLGEWWRAFPDLRFTPLDLVEQPGRVALYWTADGTHQGSFMHLPPTGRRIEVCGVSLVTIQDERIARSLHLWDMAGLLRALKLLPDLPGGPSAGPAVLLTHFLTHNQPSKAFAKKLPHPTWCPSSP